MNEQISDTEQILNEPLPGETVEQEKPVQEEEKTTEEKAPEKEEEQPEPEAEEQEEQVAEEKPKKKLSGFTRRLNREREARERAEQRASDLEARLNANRQPAAKPSTGEPEPTGYEDGINDINYIRDMAKWEGKQAYYEAKQADQQQAQQTKFQREIATANTNFETKMDDAADKYEDFDDVYKNNRIDLHPAVLHALKKSDVAGDLAYYILKNGKVGSELSNMDEIDGIRKIGQLEAKLTATVKGGKTKMPKPIKTVGEGKTKVKREFQDDMSQEDFNDSFSFSDLDTL